jgi:hypothetical protein
MRERDHFAAPQSPLNDFPCRLEPVLFDGSGQEPAKFAQPAAAGAEGHPAHGHAATSWQSRATIAMSVFQAAVKDALPDANRRLPAEVMNFVLEAIRAHDAKLIHGRDGWLTD